MSGQMRLSGVAAYAAMLLAGAGVVALVCRYGETLAAPRPIAAAATAAAVPASAASNPLLHVLLALTAVLVTGRLLGSLLRSVGQPPVIGEVLAGIFLGPSLLGQLAPAVSTYLLPPATAPFLNLIAQLGVILYMFLVGLELNGELLQGRAHATVAISHASIIAPFVLGSVLALLLYPRLSTSDVSFTSFALFMGVAMSITAFPVLARILSDRGMTRTPLGAVALTCAAADDVTAWCLLALVAGVAQARVQDAAIVVALTLGFIAMMWGAIRPLAVRIVTASRDRDPSQHAIAMTLAGLLLAALATERIGIHAVFGAFLFGAVIPHDSRLAALLKEKLEDLVTILLLPAFFAFTGMRTQIGLLTQPSEWLVCGVIVLVATAGKFGGTLAAARLTGMDWRHAAGLGILMNTRGLMQLIVLGLGLDLGVISPRLFTMMVIMALVTTMATTPVLQLLGSFSEPVPRPRRVVM
jgi:Kef-type K+ transport system membrane component KefB